MKEYWIVLGSQRQVEVYRRPEGGRYREKHLVELDQLLECASLSGMKVKVSDLFP